MKGDDARDLELQTLRDRLSRLSDASLRINESLDFDTVLHEVLDSARELTGARYAVITLLNDAGEIQDSLPSGLSSEEAEHLWELPEGWKIFHYLWGVQEPLRVRNFLAHMRSLGLPEFRPPMSVGSVVPFLAVPIRHRSEVVGNFFLAEKEVGPEFTSEDEETLVMFASQAAMVIANARRYRDEQRARADLATLVDTSPVGVAVFDVRTGTPVSFNLEAIRIVDNLWTPDQTPEQLLDVLTVRRAEGREVSLDELSMAQALSLGETVRAEEIALSVPDDRNVNALMNATPIRAENGEVGDFCRNTTGYDDFGGAGAAAGRVPVDGQPRVAYPAHLGQRLYNHAAGSSCGAEPCRDEAILRDHRRPGRPDACADERLAGCGAHRDGYVGGGPRADGRGTLGERGPQQLPRWRGRTQH